MPYLTPEQLKEVENRTGTTDLSKTQFNIKLPTGEVIPAGINPAEAATIILGGGVQQQTGLPNQVPTNIAPTAPTIPAANFPSGTPAPYQTKPIQTGIPPKPVPNTGSDIFQGKINGKIQTFTDQNAALAAGAIDIKPITAPTVSQPTPYTYLSGVSDLMSNVQIENLNKKIETLSSELAAGIKKGGTVQILTGLFEKFGIKGEQDILNQYNAQIFETTQRLRKIPDEVKKNLETLGVSENQLNRLIVKETQKPLEVLRDVMEQKGAAQERINQSLKFVGMFADAAMQDEAAKLEGVKFELETTKGVYKELKEDQRKIIDLVLDDRKNKLAFTQKLLTEGAPPDIISSAQSAGSYEEAMNIAAPFLAQQASIKTSKDIAPGIAEQIENMSDKDALSFIQKQAKEFNVDVNSLINAVEGEEGKKKEVIDEITKKDKLAQMKQFITDNPNASRAELKAELLARDNSVSQINAELDAAGIIEEKAQFTNEQLGSIVVAMMKANTKLFRGGEYERTKDQIEAGMLEVNGKTIELSERQKQDLLTKLDEQFPEKRRLIMERILPFGQ